MSIGFMFLFNSVLLGVGLAMDAFSVSLANGLNEPQMGTRRMCGIAGVFAFFQALMPMTGWVCIHTIVSRFQAFEKLIPWIALVLLLYIGSSMLKDQAVGNQVEMVGKLAILAVSAPVVLSLVETLKVFMG